MFEAHFKTPTRISSTVELQRAFNSMAVSIDEGGEVTFTGTVAVGEGVTFRGRCSLGDCTSIDKGSILTDVVLGTGNCVRAYSLLSGVVAGDRNLFGPFCFLRDGCKVGDDCILGAHVEAARSAFASGVKVSHRAFIGDATIDEMAIIGAGVVFCNWDGSDRQATHVGANAVIGSGTLLIPPLRVGTNAIVGAGSTVTRDVAAGERIIQRRG